MKAYVTFGNSRSIKEIDISFFKTLLDVLEDSQPQKADPIPISVATFQEFQAYQSFMGLGSDFNPDPNLKKFKFSFLTLGNYLYDQRFFRLIDWVRQQIISGRLRIDRKIKNKKYGLSEAYLSIIFYPISQKTYQPEDIAQLFEQNHVKHNWRRIYPFFPIDLIDGINWKINLLKAVYTPGPLKIPGLEPFGFSYFYTPYLSSCFMRRYLEWVISANLYRALKWLIKNFKLNWSDHFSNLFIRILLVEEASPQLIELVIKTFKPSKSEFLGSNRIILTKLIARNDPDLLSYFWTQFKLSDHDYQLARLHNPDSNQWNNLIQLVTHHGLDRNKQDDLSDANFISELL